jgi:hypothetical protein
MNSEYKPRCGPAAQAAIKRVLNLCGDKLSKARFDSRTATAVRLQNIALLEAAIPDMDEEARARAKWAMENLRR